MTSDALVYMVLCLFRNVLIIGLTLATIQLNVEKVKEEKHADTMTTSVIRNRRHAFAESGEVHFEEVTAEWKV